MNGPCTLHQVRIRFNPDARRPVQLCNLGQSQYVVGLRPDDMPDSGYISGLPAADGWMLISHPREGVGLVGLPLGGKDDEKGTWHKAWEDELISLDLCLSTGWTSVDDWELLAPLGATS